MSLWPSTTHFQLALPKPGLVDFSARLESALGDQVEEVGLSIRALAATDTDVAAGDLITLTGAESAESSGSLAPTGLARSPGSSVLIDLINITALTGSPGDISGAAQGSITGSGSGGAGIKPVGASQVGIMVGDAERSVSNPTGFVVGAGLGVFDGTQSLVQHVVDALPAPSIEGASGGAGTWYAWWPCWIPAGFGSFFNGDAAPVFTVRAKGSGTITLTFIDSDGTPVSGSAAALAAGYGDYTLLYDDVSGATVNRLSLCWLRATIVAASASAVRATALRRYQPRRAF